jgi:hypothetical protein
MVLRRLNVVVSALMLSSAVLFAQTQTDSRLQKPSAAKHIQAKTAAAPAQDVDDQSEEAMAPAAEKPLPALPIGTAVKMRLETALSTTTNKAGDRFAGRVIEDVAFKGKTVIPVGSSIHGRVVRVTEQRRYKGLPTLELHPDQVTLPNGDKFIFDAVVADTGVGSKTSVDDEGRIRGEGMNGRDKMEVAGGTTLGAGMGALIGRSGTGTLVGAAVGGGAAVIYWLSKYKTASLAPGTEIIMELSRPMSMSAASD